MNTIGRRFIPNLTRLFRRQVSAVPQKPRVLITGVHGQLGRNLSKKLRELHGNDNVIASDIVRPAKEVVRAGPYLYADVRDKNQLRSIIVNHDVSWIIHLSAILSAIGEVNVQRSLDINVIGLMNILEVATEYDCRLFIPSTMGVFGLDAPLDFTPDVCIQRPTTIYGVAKVFAELLGQYYARKFDLDFRCLRIPGVLSPDAQPTGGTTDYAVEVFHSIINTSAYDCYLRPDTNLPMMYIDDCVRAIVEFMSVPKVALPKNVYNIAAVSFTPEELFSEIKLRFPLAEFSFSPDHRQMIADTWPRVFDDSAARLDWRWKHEYGIKEIVETMFTKIHALQKQM